MKFFIGKNIVSTVCLALYVLLVVAASDAFAAENSEKWWEAITPEGKIGIMAVAVAGIAVLIVFITVLKPKMPGSGNKDFTLEKYEEDLRDKIAEMKVDL